jgi:acylphosphatase
LLVITENALLGPKAMATTNYEIVHFSGRVQGVGFRYNVIRVAKEYEVCGFVQNLTDGRVLVEVEGEGAEIDSFVDGIHERMDGFVRKVERQRTRRDGEFTGFTIR